MVVFPVLLKRSDSHLLFPVVKKIDIKINEVVCVYLNENKKIAGIVDEICDDDEHFWLRASSDLNSKRERFSFKLDQVVKLN